MCSLPEVKSCCCCCSLRTGTKVFGFFSLCRCIFVIFILTLEISAIARRNPDEYEEFSQVTSLGILIRLIHGTASLFMLVAAYQESRRFLVPWIVTTIAVIIINIILESELTQILVDFHHQQFWAILSVITLVIDLYGILIVNSYYLSLTSLHCQAT